MKDNHDTPVKRPDLNRRRVIGSALGIGSAVGLGLLSTTTAASPVDTPKSEPDSKKYRESEHIRRYYQSARQ